MAASAGTVSQPAAACERCAELSRRCGELGEKCSDPRAALAAALARIEALEGQRKEFQRDKFGRKSEAVGPPATTEPVKQSDKKPPDAPGGGRRKSKRSRGRQPGAPTPPRVDHSHLPVEREIAQPKEEDCAWPQCGKPCKPHGAETSRVIELRTEAFLREIRRLRFRPACQCEQASEAVAPPVPRLLPNSPFGVTVRAWFLVQVFAHFRPRAAAVRDLAALGLRVPAGTLSRGLGGLGKLFEPLVAAIRARQEGAAVAHADETSWSVQMLDSKGGRARHWLWVCLAAGTVRMRILPTRGTLSAKELLGAFGRDGPAVVACDRWSACKALAKQVEGEIRLAFCRARQRRDFRRVGTAFADLEGWSDGWLERVGRLFHLARLRREAWQPALPLERQPAEFQSLQRQLQGELAELFRQAREEGLQAVRDWKPAEALQDGPARERADAKGRALRSLLQHRAGLSLFASDPRVPMDSNAAERALRGPVIGRLTSLGSGSPQGAELTARLHSVFGTLRVAGLNPCSWMEAYLEACARNGGRAPEQLDRWLPRAMDEERRQALSQAPPARHAEASPTAPAITDEPVPQPQPLAQAA